MGADASDWVGALDSARAALALRRNDAAAWYALGVLFENRRVITEFERFFLHAVREAMPGHPWPAAPR